MTISIPPSPSTRSLPHHKLIAYQRAVELLQAVRFAGIPASVTGESSVIDTGTAGTGDEASAGGCSAEAVLVGAASIGAASILAGDANAASLAPASPAAGECGRQLTTPIITPIAVKRMAAGYVSGSA